MTNPGEYTAVIMAAGSGSRMTDLTAQCPKPLLPVGRFPMVWYPLRSLEKAGFIDVIIITRQSWRDQLQSSLLSDAIPTRANLEFVDVPDNEDFGTADSLRYIAGRVKTSVLVITCDLVSDCDLTELVSKHRKYNSSLTLMLSQIPSVITADTPVPGFKSKQKSDNTAEKISMGFDNSNMEHLVYWKAQIDMEDEHLSFTRKFLERFPCTRIQSTWTDCHVYLMNKCIINFLKDKTELSSLQGELVPLVVKKQLLSYVPEKTKDETEMSPGNDARKADKKKDLIDYAGEDRSDLSRYAASLSLTSPYFGSSQDSPQKDVVCCYSYKQSQGFCVRANTIGSYFEACKQIPRLVNHFLPSKTGNCPNVPESTSMKSKSQVGADSMLGESGTIGEKVSVKKSVLGNHCKVGDRVKITNSVIMDHVIIHESSVINNCIIASSASVGDKCELSNCIVGQNQNISTMSKHTNEVLSAHSQMMEVTLE